MERSGQINPDVPSNTFLEILNMRSISCKKHRNFEYGIIIFKTTWHGHFGYSNQYLTKNMKWTFGNVGSISIKNHEMEVWQFSEYGINIFRRNMNWTFRNSNLKELEYLNCFWSTCNLTGECELAISIWQFLNGEHAIWSGNFSVENQHKIRICGLGRGQV